MVARGRTPFGVRHIQPTQKIVNEKRPYDLKSTWTYCRRCGDWTLARSTSKCVKRVAKRVGRETRRDLVDWTDGTQTDGQRRNRRR